MFWKEIFVRKTLLDVDDVSHTIGVGAVELLPGPVNFVSLDDLTVGVYVFLMAEVDTLLGSFDSSNQRSRDRVSIEHQWKL